MKILVVHNRYRSEAPSGENRVVDQEGAALEAAGHTVRHYERFSDDIAQWSIARRATLPAKVLWSEGARRELTAAIRTFQPDVVHLHNTFPLISSSVLYACHREGVPLVATLHNYKLLCATGDFFREQQVCHECANGSARPALIHRCYRESAFATAPITAGLVTHRRAWRTLVSAYICLSATQRDLLAGLRLPGERVFVKWNLVPPNRPAPKPPLERGVAYLGRLDEAKGIPLLMAAWDLYSRESAEDSLRLSIAGGGPLEPQVRAWAAGRADVELLGVLDGDGCARLAAASLAVILPSQWEETFGLVAIEAMSNATAPLAVNHGAFRELVTSGVNGTLFEPGSPRNLAEALRRIDRDPQHYRELGQLAKDYYLDHFTAAVNIAELITIYKYAINNSRASARFGPVRRRAEHSAAHSE